MKREILEFTSEAEWLAMREKDLTSTEVSALFGCSPYSTAYGLFHRKTGQLEADFEANDRTRWGNRLESAIAYGIAEDFGLVVEPFKVYARMPDQRLGSSFDFRIVGIVDGYTGENESYRDLFRDNGPGIMEVKNVDGLQFKRAWADDEEGLEAPPHIELQVQHQLEVADMEWTLVAPLVGGNTPRAFARMRDRQVGAAIHAKAAEFWKMVDEGKAPAPDFSADADTIGRLLYNSNGETVDMSYNEQLAKLVADHEAASATFKAAESKKKALKAEILTVIGASAKVTMKGQYISAGTVADSLGTLIDASMIGKRIGARSGHRMMRLYKNSKSK